jgi:hypothetical protein
MLELEASSQTALYRVGDSAKLRANAGTEHELLEFERWED